MFNLNILEEYMNIATTKDDSYGIDDFDNIENFLSNIGKLNENKLVQIFLNDKVDYEFYRNSSLKLIFWSSSMFENKDYIYLNIFTNSTINFFNYSFTNASHRAIKKNEFKTANKKNDMKQIYDLEVPYKNFFLKIYLDCLNDINRVTLYLSGEYITEFSTEPTTREITTTTTSATTTTTYSINNITNSTQSPFETCVNSYGLNKIDGICIDINDCSGAGFIGNCTNRNFVCCVKDTDPLYTHQNEMITENLFLNLTSNTIRNRVLYRYFVQSMNDSIITNQYRAAAFFATLVGESDGFKYFEYRGSIGGQNDDSVYRGRGAIFLKGKQDYELASKALGNI